MSYFRVTLRRSTIGLPTPLSGVVQALGLRRRMQSVYHPVSQDIAGMIMKVKELVEVQTVTRSLSKQQIRALRRPNPGFYVETPAARPIDIPAESAK